MASPTQETWKKRDHKSEKRRKKRAKKTRKEVLKNNAKGLI